MKERYYSGSRVGMVAFVPRSYARVLEIGCGQGRFADCLRPDSMKWGVEMHAPSAKLAETRFERVLVGTYREVEGDLPDGYFDLVVCNDVIEHMPDAEAFLVDVQRKITPGGHLVGSVPNVRYYRNLFNLLVRKDWRYTDSGVLDRTHQRFFTLRSLRRHSSESGYEIVVLRGIGSEFRAGARSLWTRLARNALLVTILFATLGSSLDIRYSQLGFCLRRA